MKGRFLLVTASVAGALCAGGGARARAAANPGGVAGEADLRKSPGSVTTYSGLRLTVVHLGKRVFDMPVKSSLFPAGRPRPAA